MKSFLIVLLLPFFFISCKDAGPSSGSEKTASSLQDDFEERTPFSDEQIFKIGDIGILSMNGLIPFSTDLTADLGSQRWIFKLSPEGKAEWALLLVLKNFRDQDRREVKAFLETYEDGWRIRRLITTDETIIRLNQISSVIRTTGHERRYNYFYDGGTMESHSGTASDDPFGADPQDRRNEDEWIKELNDYTLSGIAEWTRYFRIGNGLPLYEFPEGTVGSVVDLGEVSEVAVFDGNYEPRKRAPRQLNTRFEMGEVIREIGPKNNDGKLPLVFTPHFAVLVLLGEGGEVVSKISVQTAYSYCVARAGMSDEKGRYIIDHDTIQAEFYSPELSKLLYDSFAENDPEYLDEMRDFFKGGPSTLEEALLLKKGDE